MALLGKRMGIAIPDTVLEERESLREKTVKLGAIARACSIYGVDNILVFRDERRRGEAALICKVLEYLETPQYLRRRLYSYEEALRFAGLLPPLRIPSHKPKVPVDKLTVGEIREGVTNADGTVDIGLDLNPRLRERTAPKKRVTVRIVSKAPLEADLAKREHAHDYWGYEVETVSIGELFTDPRFSLRIATSRYGNSLQSQVFRLRESIRDSGSIELIFGSPMRGLFDMVGKELSQRVDFVINLFAEQHVETVRTEEAVYAGLNLVNILAT